MILVNGYCWSSNNDMRFVGFEDVVTTNVANNFANLKVYDVSQAVSFLIDIDYGAGGGGGASAGKRVLAIG